MAESGGQTAVTPESAGNDTRVRRERHPRQDEKLHDSRRHRTDALGSTPWDRRPGTSFTLGHPVPTRRVNPFAFFVLLTESSTALSQPDVFVDSHGFPSTTVCLQPPTEPVAWVGKRNNRGGPYQSPSQTSESLPCSPAPYSEGKVLRSARVRRGLPQRAREPPCTSPSAVILPARTLSSID